MTSRPADRHGDWVLWGPEYARSRLYLQPRLIAALEADQLLRAREAHAAGLAAEEVRRTEHAFAALKKEPIKAESIPPADSAVRGRVHRHEVGRHQIFPHLREVEERLERTRAGLHGELDVVQRQITALSAALGGGPTRSIARRADWKQALGDLTAELPAFRGAIEIIRNAFALSDRTGAAPAIPPILIVGFPGVGKSHFCRRLAQTLDAGSHWVAMDQHTAGVELRGTDKHWSTSSHGAVFELLGLGDTANPVIVLDEIDKAARSTGHRGIDMLAQLYSSLEPETARYLSDASLDVEMDARLISWIATANSLNPLDAPLLSRFEVVQVGLPSPAERREATDRMIGSALERLGVNGAVKLSSGCMPLLEQCSARIALRAIEKAVGAAVARGSDKVSAQDMEMVLGIAPQSAFDPPTLCH